MIIIALPVSSADQLLIIILNSAGEVKKRPKLAASSYRWSIATGEQHSWSTVLDQQFIDSAERLGASEQELIYLQALLAAQAASWPTAGEERVANRARQLIRGRGWPTEKIRPFFLEDRQLYQLSKEFNDCQVEPDKISHSWRPWTIGPTAVGIPRSAVTDLNELEVTRVVIHEFVHARSLALPQRNKLPANWSERLGLYQISEGITELIAEEILPLSSRMAQAAPLLVATREWSAELSQQAGLDLPALERLAIPEVFKALSESLGYSLSQLAELIEQRTASYQQRSGETNLA